MATENIIAALDIGTTKIVCLVGEMDENGHIYVIGHGNSPAEGLRRGIVVDMEKTVTSIRKAIDDTQLVSGTEIDRVTVGIAGEHIRSINSHGVVAVSRTDNEITSQDVNKAIDAARAVAIPVDREIIHVIPQEYSVDEQDGIKDPVGMTGVRLEVEAHIVTASVTSAKNIYRALERCNLGVDHMVLESLALSRVQLTEAEMQSGVIIVDIGGDITNISVFYDDAIRYTGVVSLGSKNVTNDIAIGLRTSVDQAEELKLSHGCALASMVDPEDMIVVGGALMRPDKEVSRNVLASIIEPRMEEIFSLVDREIKKAGIHDMPAAGIVLSGGGALLDGTVELAEQIFDMPVRLGRIERIEHTPDEINNVGYATAHGLLAYGFHHEPSKGSRGSGVKGLLKKFENWITKQF
jgi:cell division protein FtsA